MLGTLLLLVSATTNGFAQTLVKIPPPSFQLTPAGITIAATMNNPRTTATGALRLEVWAFALPFSLQGTTQAGYKLATLNLAALPAGATGNLSPQAVAYLPPAAGTWTVTLLFLEDTGGGFGVRDFFNFPALLPVSGIMATYQPVPPPFNVPGPLVAVTLNNLLVDNSRVYWCVVDSATIGSVGIVPGSQPATLAALGGGFVGPFTFVQDNLYLYAIQGLVSGDRIVRVAKTTGAQTVLAVAAPDTQGPRFQSIGIQLTGGVLYFSARQIVPGGVGSFMARMSTQGGTITRFGTTPPPSINAAAANVSPNSFAADLTNIYWADAWEQTIRRMPLLGGSSTVEVNVPNNASFLQAPTHGPAGSSLFWVESFAGTTRLQRRRPGGQVITVTNALLTPNYALDGDRVYFFSRVTTQLSSVSIDGGAITALMPLDTEIPGEIATDGNAIYWVATSISSRAQVRRLPLPVRGVPVVNQPPISQYIAPNAPLITFTALASSGGLSFVWKHNGVAIVPATASDGMMQPAAGTPPRAGAIVNNTANTSALTLTDVTAADLGFYSCVITNSMGSVETEAAVLAFDTGGPSRIINVSTRGLVQAGAALTPGFVMRGAGSKQLLIRAVGPTLSSFGLAGLADTKMDVLNQQTGASVVTNDDWGGGAALTNTFTAVGAFPLTGTSKDAAVISSVPVNANGYSVRITAAGTASTGIALAEVYDADPLSSPAKLINVSTLGFAGTGANALTPGFVIGGTGSKRVLIRAVGPGLAAFGVPGTVADPQLTVIPLGLNVTVARSDDWGGTAELKAAFASAGAFGLDDNSKDAAVVVRLPPGGYSVVVAGASGATGTALVEVYDLDP
jgi:hypothetical protein